MKITHVAEIVNIGHVARILEAEICGAENVCAILLYNLSQWPISRLKQLKGKNWDWLTRALFLQNGIPLTVATIRL